MTTQRSLAIILAEQTDKLDAETKTEPMVAPFHPQQRRIWLAHQQDPEAHHQTMMSCYRVTGNVDPARLEKALNFVTKRHDLLRSKVEDEVWKLQSNWTPHLERREVSGADFDAALRDLGQTIFDPTSGPPWSFHLLQSQDEAALVLLGHDLLLDGWSVVTFWKELGLAWSERHAELRTTASFLQFAEEAKGPEPVDQTYWRKHLAGVPSALPLPLPPPSSADDRSRSIVEISFPASTLADLVRESGQSKAALVLAGLSLLLSRVWGRDDLTIGVPYLNRTTPQSQELIGFLMSLLPLRFKPQRETVLRDYLAEASDTLWQGITHGSIPLDQLLADPQIPFSGVKDAFDILFSYQSAQELDSALELPDHSCTAAFPDRGAAKAGLTVFAQDRGETLTLLAEFDPKSYDRDAVASFLQQLAALLGKMGDGLDETIATFSEKSASSHATGDALETGWSLEELKSPGSGSVAAFLARQEISADAPVAILGERDSSTIDGMFGALRAGLPYLFLDPKLPVSRLQKLLTNAQPSVLLHQGQELVTDLGFESTQANLLDLATSDFRSKEPINNEKLAYVLFTSGSTGEPKGACITRANLEHSTAARLQFYREYHQPKRFLLFPSFGFDSSIAVIYWANATDAELVIASDAEREDLRALADKIAASNIDSLLCTPAVYSRLLHFREKLKSLRLVIVAGESCPPALVHDHLERLPETDLFNEYGPTEATVWTTAHRCTATDADSGRVPIGCPIPGSTVEIANEANEVVPLNTIGELVVRGQGVARGYLGEPEWKDHVYRTGDRAWMDDQGRCWFVGRQDSQIKIRGQRIDLEEIRQCLRAMPDVADAGAVVSDDQKLIAFIASTTQGEESIWKHLHQQLPSAAIPNAIRVMPELAYTSNGKLDLGKLQSKNGDGEASSQPIAEDEAAKLAMIWEEVLETFDVTTNDDFFELGGDSLTSIDLMIRIEKGWGTKLTVEQLRRSSGFCEMLALLRPEAKEERTSDRIFAYNRAGTKTPILWLHKGVRLAEGYDDNQPLYLIRDPVPFRIEGGKAHWISIQEMAKEMIDEFDRTYPDVEDFVFGAHCIGALVAYEMARQWRNQGRSILGLVLTGPAVPNLEEFRVHSEISSKPYSREEQLQKPIRAFVQTRMSWLWKKLVYLSHLRRHYTTWFEGARNGIRARRKIANNEELNRKEKVSLEFWAYAEILKDPKLESHDGPTLLIDGPYRGYDACSEWKPFMTGDFEFKLYPDYGPALNTEKELKWIRQAITEFTEKVSA